MVPYHLSDSSVRHCPNPSFIRNTIRVDLLDFVTQSLEISRTQVSQMSLKLNIPTTFLNRTGRQLRPSSFSNKSSTFEEITLFENGNLI